MEERETEQEQRISEAATDVGVWLYNTLRSKMNEGFCCTCPVTELRKAPTVNISDKGTDRLARILAALKPCYYRSMLPDTPAITLMVREAALEHARSELIRIQEKLNTAVETQQITGYIKGAMWKIGMETQKMREERTSFSMDTANAAVELEQCKILIEFLKEHLHLNLPRPS